MENSEQTQEKSYEFTEDELRRILFAAEDVFAAIDNATCGAKTENGLTPCKVNFIKQ